MRRGFASVLACCMATLAVGLAGCGDSAPSVGSTAEEVGSLETVAVGDDAPQSEQPAPQSEQPAQQRQQDTTQPAGYGNTFTRQDVIDTQLGVDVFSAFVPSGWSVDIQSDWTRINPLYPGYELVTLTSPDGQASVAFGSAEMFVQHPYGDQGPNEMSYTTYWDYMDAATYSDTYISSTYGEDAILVGEADTDQETINALWQCALQFAEEGNQDAATLTNNGALGSTLYCEAVDATHSRRQYQVSDGYVETTVADYAVSETITNSALGDMTYVNWFIPYSIVYKAATDEAFESYYADYELIVANSAFTPSFYSANSYVSSMIGASLTEIQNAVSNYSSSGYESPTAYSDSVSVAEQWDDVIMERDTYNTLDGGTISVSTQNDVVAQDGDTFYVGSYGDMPSGFTQLSVR